MDQARYGKWAARLYLIGLPPLIGLAAWSWHSGFDYLQTATSALLLAKPFFPVVMLAHASFLLWAIKRFAGSAMMGRVAAAGRAAFTNYIGTSILMTTLFYGYGFGRSGKCRARASI